MIHRFHCVFGCLFVLASAVSLTAQIFKVIHSPGSETAYSAGVLANVTLYVSGQGSSARTFPEQMGDAMRKVQAILRGAGMNFDNVVWMNIYVTDAHNLAAMDDVYWQLIGSSPPARTVLTVAALPGGEM